MKDDMAKKMLEKYYGKTFIEIEKVAKAIEEINDKMDVLRSHIMNGKTYKRELCKASGGMCACSGQCYPADFTAVDNAIYAAKSDLDLYKFLTK